MRTSVHHPEIRLAGDGAFHFSVPLPEGTLAPMLGSTIEVSIDGLTFPVVIDRQIFLPPACRTIQEAKYFAAAISFELALNALSDAVETLADTVRFEDTAGNGETPDARILAARICAGSPAANTHRLSSIFAAWRSNHLAHGGAPTTPPYWELLLDRFSQYLGHDDIRSITAQDIRNYRDHLLQSGRNARTARHADFAAIRAVFAFAVERELVASNPTIGVKFRLDRLNAAKRMLGFSDDEARRILSACDTQTIPSRRWIPWLCAFTGGRVATIANLRKQDVLQVDGYWCLRFTRAAGPIKTAASERVVPLHPAILDRGFLDFVAGVRGERLFFSPSDHPINGTSRSNPFDDHSKLRYNPSRSVSRRVTEWLHTLGLEIGRSNRKDPNHAWRHWFKEQAFAAGIPEKIADAIVGHAAATTSRRYGSISISAMNAEILKLPSPVAVNTAIRWTQAAEMQNPGGRPPGSLSDPESSDQKLR